MRGPLSLQSSQMEDSSENNEYITAPEVFVRTLASQVNQHDVLSLISAQKEMLGRFEKTNEMLVNYNSLSSMRLETVSRDFKKHTIVLTEMKKDLDVVFRKIRFLKSRLKSQYPTAFSATESCHKNIKSSLAEEDEEQAEEESSSSTKKEASHSEQVQDIKTDCVESDLTNKAAGCHKIDEHTS